MTRATMRTEAIDRRDAAVHEAGHIVAARYVRRDPLPYGSIWLGTHNHPTKIGSTYTQWTGESFTYLESDNATLRDLRLVNVAGAVAETMWYRFDVRYSEIYDLMSKEDRELEGARAFDPETATPRETRAWQNAIARACELFNPDTGKLWRALYREARKLIVTSRAEVELQLMKRDTERHLPSL